MAETRADLLITNLDCLATPTSDGFLCLRDAALAALGETIVFVGHSEAAAGIELTEGATSMNGRGKTAIPGFVDSHTHLPFAGERVDDPERRLAGATYKEILDAGGGIHRTVSATRAASLDLLRDRCLERLDRMLVAGTTTCEAKSGYGMELATELRQLEAVRDAAKRHPVTIHPTFLGAHVIPVEYSDRRGDYLDLLIREMLPRVAEEGLATGCDVFCEEGVYTVAESRRILTAARDLGLSLHLHADELASTGGAELAAELGALSADHLVHVSDEGLRAMAEAAVSAVLLPATTFYLCHRDYAPGRGFLDAGVPVALATDLNPGSSFTYSMAHVIALACFQMKLSMNEALSAATLGGARALGVEEEVGSLDLGKRADIQILDVPDYRHLVYQWDRNQVETVLKGGKVVVEKGQRIA